MKDRQIAFAPVQIDGARQFEPGTEYQALAMSAACESMTRWAGRFEAVHHCPPTQAEYQQWQQVGADLCEHIRGLALRSGRITAVVLHNLPDVLRPVQVNADQWYQPVGYADELAVAALYEPLPAWRVRFLVWTGHRATDADASLWRARGREHANRYMQQNGLQVYRSESTLVGA